MTWLFVNDALDETYTGGPIPFFVSEQDLPPEDLEVRQGLLSYKLALERTNLLHFFSVLFRTAKAQAVFGQVQREHAKLMAFVNKSPEHKAAIRRIVNDMPEGNGGREILAEFVE